MIGRGEAAEGIPLRRSICTNPMRRVGLSGSMCVSRDKSLGAYIPGRLTLVDCPQGGHCCGVEGHHSGGFCRGGAGGTARVQPYVFKSSISLGMWNRWGIQRAL